MGYVRVLILPAAALIAAVLGAAGPSGPVPALAVPANDSFGSAIAVATPATSGIVATGSTVGATTQSGEPTALPSCQRYNPSAPMGATVWFNWTSPGTAGTIVFSTAGSDYDTFVGVHTGNAVNALTTVVCMNDFWNVQDTRTSLALNYAASTTYRIQLGGASGATGNFVLSIITGAELFVTHGADNTSIDGSMSLREAMLLALGGTTASGLNRSPDAGETFATTNAGAAGAASSDVVHFNGGSFPVGAPGTVTLGSGLPDLTTNNDTVSGIGTGVIIDGVNASLICFAISGAGNVMEGLQVRRCSYGLFITGANNRVGGAVIAAQRNVVRENLLGITLFASGTGNRVIGNLIGTTADGLSALGNSTGVVLRSTATGNQIGGSLPGEGNIISGNTAQGILIIENAASNVVSGNKIGVNILGAALGNSNEGIDVAENVSGQVQNDNLIGGVTPGASNVLAYNGNNGVRINSGVRITVRGNSIHSNSVSGITVDAGENGGIPKPAIFTATANSVSGSGCPLCTIDVYNDAASQGRLYIGTGTADAGGAFSFSIGAHPLGFITATSTDASGNTSEFSLAVAAPLNADGDGLPDASDACPSVAEDYDGFQDGDGCPEPDNDVDGVCDAGQTSVSCSGSDVGKYCFDAAGNLACHLAAPSDCRNVAEDLDAFKDTDGCPEADNDNDGFPDVTDQCPGTGSQAGADGMLGSPQDLNHNGIQDGGEALLTTDDIPTYAFEDRDGVLDTDGCHDSPGEDFDGDGFTDDVEALKIGTNPGYPCGNPGWPADLLADNRLNIGDLNSFLFPLRGNGSFNKIFHPVPDRDDANIGRWDLQPSSAIDVGDLNALNPAVLAPTARPPMFGGQPAFFANAGNGVGGCPLPP